jgi:Tfp pilus assembly protein PilV
MIRRGELERGFTLLEVVIGLVAIVVGLLALAGVLVAVSHQREQTVVRGKVLRAAQDLIEDLRNADPVSLDADYCGRTWPVDGVEGTNPLGDCLSVDVNDSNPKLLWVTVDGMWAAAGSPGSVRLETYVYNPNG